MRIAKRIVLLMLVLTIIVGGCGCRMRTNSKNRKENTQGKIIASMREHLDDKYGYIDYEIEGFIGAGWDPYDLLNLSTEIDGVKESFHVERHKTDNGYEFYDNYFGLVIRDAFEEKVYEKVKNFFEDCKVFCHMQTTNYSNMLGKESTLEDLLEVKTDMSHIIIMVIVNETFQNEEVFMEQAKKFINSWKEEGIKTFMRIFYVNADGYEMLEKNNCGEIINNYLIKDYQEVIE